jgi:SagB-type dehydrogenase family enzyme
MAEIVKLPPPIYKGTMSLEEAISKRRSIREYRTEPLFLAQLSQLLWAAQGITGNSGGRVVPSAGATYPLEIYVTTWKETVEKLKAGIYRYEVGYHALILHQEGDFRVQLSEAALDQGSVASCSADIIVCAIYSRTIHRYGNRAERYIHMEAGHVGQNVSLEAVSLGLSTVMVGAFQDDRLAKVLYLEKHVEPLYIIPVGKPA